MKIESAAACRFFTAEQALGWALKAYYGACRDVEPPAGEPWWVEGCAWSSPALFGDAVITRFMAQVVAAAIDAQIPCDHGCATPSFTWDDSAFFARSELNGLPLGDNAPDNQAGSSSHGG